VRRRGAARQGCGPPSAVTAIRRFRLPSLFRFLFVLGVLAALVYGGMVALVAYVQVEPREITQSVPLPRPPQ
jgi:hypothetical protein